MSSETVEGVKTEEATEPVASEIIETTNEEPTETIKQEETITTPVEQPTEQTQPTAKAKPKAQPKKLARSVKVVELVECEACNKKMLPKSLRNTHPYYCKGQPTETLPVNRQKARYGSKVEQKLRKEIEEEMEAKYNTGGVLGGSATYANQEQPKQNEVVQYSEPIEVKTRQRPVRTEEAPPTRQLTATELLQQSYNEMKKLRQQEKAEKIARFKTSMF